MANAQTAGIVLVTGSTGLIGSRLMRQLAGPYHVVGLDIQEQVDLPPHAEWYYVDLTRDASVGRVLRQIRSHHGDRVASVVHLAAYYDFAGEPSPLYEKVTVQGTQRLLRGLQVFDVEQFVFSSTMLVHAPCEPGRRIDEEWPLEPKWDYPRSKVQTEQVIEKEAGRIPYAILRIAGGYDERGHSPPLTQQMKRIHERRLVSRVFPGDTSRGQAFVHLEDTVEALRLCVERRHELPPRTVLLIGEDETLSYEELQQAFGLLLHGEEWSTTQIPKAVAKTGAWVQDALPGEEPFIKPWMIDLADDHYALDITRAKRVLGWAPRHSLRGTLPKMAASLKSDPAGFYRENDLGEPPS